MQLFSKQNLSWVIQPFKSIYNIFLTYINIYVKKRNYLWTNNLYILNNIAHYEVKYYYENITIILNLGYNLIKTLKNT